MLQAQLQQLRDKMIRKTFSTGERVINEGDPGSAFYVITQGYATVSRKKESKFVGGVRVENSEEDEIGVLSMHSCFGESALISNNPRNASVSARGTGELQTLMLDRDTFEKVLGPLSQIIEEAAAQRDRIAKMAQVELQASGLTDAKITSFKLSRLVRGTPSLAHFFLVKCAAPQIAGPPELVVRLATEIAHPSPDSLP